ncbi:MAG: hypothetical protein CSB06_01365 [Bacteroidia bacterium]|nr:MAG: hypothetical protein CSB06_01365 [Bacteroidia bacterium]
MKFTLFKPFKGDRVLWGMSVLLLLVSLPLVYSASAKLAEKASAGDMHFFFRQVVSVIGAFAIIFVVSKIHYRTYMSFSKAIFSGAILLGILTLFIGTAHNGASRWLRIPGTPIELQASEIVKFAVILFMAKLLTIQKEDPKYKRQVRIATLGGLLGAGIIYPADFSSSLLVVVIVFVMLFIAEVRLKDIFVILLLVFIAFLLYGLVADWLGLPGRISTAKHRIRTFLAGSNTINANDTYQIDMSKGAIVEGGLTGCGPGGGTTRYLLPQAHSDFLFAFIIQEYGFLLGAIPLCIIYSVLAGKGLLIARYTKSLFAAYLANGISFAIVIQAMVHMSVSVGLLPTTGQPLPFLSSGRTSLWMTAGCIGILLNISKETKEKEV